MLNDSFDSVQTGDSVDMDNPPMPCDFDGGVLYELGSDHVVGYGSPAISRSSADVASKSQLACIFFNLLPYDGDNVYNHNDAAAPSVSTAQSHWTLPSTRSVLHSQATPLTSATESSNSGQGFRLSAYSFSVLFTARGIAYEELSQNVYDRGVMSEAFLLPDIPFQCINLGDALRSDFRWLQDPGREAWPAAWSLGIPQKLAVVFCFPGYSKYSRQVNVLRHIRGCSLPQTRSKVAQMIATEMQSFLNLVRETGKPLVHRGRQVCLDDLLLINVQHISKGSLQPTIGVAAPGPDATPRR